MQGIAPSVIAAEEALASEFADGERDSRSLGADDLAEHLMGYPEWHDGAACCDSAPVARQMPEREQHPSVTLPT